MSVIYLRDLKEGTIKDEYEAEIRRERPDLIPALENGDDIIIAESYKPEDYEV